MACLGDTVRVLTNNTVGLAKAWWKDANGHLRWTVEVTAKDGSKSYNSCRASDLEVLPDEPGKVTYSIEVTY